MAKKTEWEFCDFVSTKVQSSKTGTQAFHPSECCQVVSYQGRRQDFARGGADVRPGRPMSLRPGLEAARGPHMPTNI